MRLPHALAAVSFAALAAAPALAIDIPGTGFGVSGEAALVSDYRYRGVSQTGGDPALQAGVTLEHDSGLYAGVWGSNIDLYDDDPTIGFDGGSDVELDLYGGWAKELAPGTTLDVGLLYYAYPRVSGTTDFFEASGSLAQQFGPLEAKVGASYAWDQKAIADDILYLYGDLSAGIPLTPLTLKGHLGRQDFGPGFGPGVDSWDWSLGVETSFGPLTAGLSYVDSDIRGVPHSGAAVVASVGLSF